MMILLGKRILCKKIEVTENKTASGLILPNSVKDEHEFEVIKVGSKVEYLKIGDLIRKYKYSEGTQVVHNGESCVIFNEDSDVEFVIHH